MNKSQKFDIAIIGAGIAGLVCSQELQQAGYSVVVLEKSRGVGGRMATRRVSGSRADHGVRYLEPTDQLLQQFPPWDHKSVLFRWLNDRVTACFRWF